MTARSVVGLSILSPVIALTLFQLSKPKWKKFSFSWPTLPLMSSVKSRKGRFSPDDTYAWLEKQMAKQGLTSLEELSQASGIDRGTLSRYFRQERRPSVDVIAPLCQALDVAPETLLIALGALDRRS
jgi:DNA-binding Xre family transcriptional regulator